MRSFYIKYCVFGFFILYIFTFLEFPIGFVNDVQCYVDWAVEIKKNGVAYAYESKIVDYPPTFVYFLAVKSFFYNSIHQIQSDFLSLKIITFISSIFNGIVIVKIVNFISPNLNSKSALVIALLYLLNPGILFNTLIWGQVDEIAVFLMLISFYLFIKESFYFGFIGFILLLNFKMQTIISLPFFALLYILKLKNNKKPYLTFFKHFVFCAIAVYLFYLPFILNHQVYRFFQTIRMVDAFPKVTVFAYNFWYLVFKNPDLLSDKETVFLSLNLKYLSIIIFLSFTGSLILGYFVNHIKKKDLNLSKFFMLFGISNLIFFFVLTQMHERYSHFAFFSILVCYGAQRNKWVILSYVILSLSYFINLLHVLIRTYPNLYRLHFDLNESVVSYGYFFGIIVLMFIYFKDQKIYRETQLKN